jgi:hypothetical protein
VPLPCPMLCWRIRFSSPKTRSRQCKCWPTMCAANGGAE